MHNTDVLIDMDACAARMVHMLRTATHTVYYSAFVCQMDLTLPGQPPGTTMNTLTSEAVERGVRVHMLFNNSTQYGNKPLHEMGTHPHVQVRGVVGDGHIPFPFNTLFGDTYTNHHQKFLLVDDAHIMVGGVGVDPCRRGWLVQNNEEPPYYWHEVGVVTECSPAMAAWVKAQWEGVFQTPPYPLVSSLSEHETTLQLIQHAKTCIHMEAQLCISTDTTKNQVLTSVARRLAKAYHSQNDHFRFMLLVNTHQPDEHAVVSSITTATLQWSMRMLLEAAKNMGVPPSFFNERVFVGTMEHQHAHVKVHSNLIIQDGHTLLRSSSNLTDRSLSSQPCDNELGIVIKNHEVVPLTQQRLWQRYLDLSPTTFINPIQAHAMMQEERGVVRKVRAPPKNTLMDACMNTLHKLPYFGGKQFIRWKLE